VPLEARIASLFADGEEGAWYDPSNLSTLYQDAAGTTPVTALGQPVGLMLDKSKGLVRGPELVVNGGFDSDLSGWSVTGPTTATWSAGAAALSRALGNGRFWQNMSGLTVGRMYQVAFDVLALSNTLDLAFGVAGAAPSNSFVSGVNAAGTYTGMFTATATSHSVGCILQGSSTATGTIDNISVRELPGNHASQPTATARPTLQADASGRKYLQFDGVDDSMTVPTLDLTSTDKITVSTGVRKQSDAGAYGTICEHSISVNANNGTFALFAPAAADSATFVGYGHGTTVDRIALSDAIYPAPISTVVTLVIDIAGDLTKLRVGGTDAKVTSLDMGTGTFGTYPLYIGRRNESSLPFNGRIYSLLIRGALSTAAQIAAAERYAAVKTGVTLA